MSQAISRVRGMYDVLPDQTWQWQRAENIMRRLFQQYGYREIRFPIVEKTALFCSAIGEVTDIVEKEMYTFSDRKGESLSLRPEGTAPCVRALIQNNLMASGPQKLWYSGPMFRYERPQKGRNRQFQQVGVEYFGNPGPQADAEILILGQRLWKELGLDAQAHPVRLEINSLGTAESRGRYREALIGYLEGHKDLLDEDAKRRLYSNPLRILDSKNPLMQDLIAQAPLLRDFLDQESLRHHEQLKHLLDAAGVEYVENPRLVRGLDYYGKTVFEWISDDLGAQGTICGGGRYDTLVERQGGKPTPAVGFALGLDRLLLLIETLGLWQAEPLADIYLVSEAGVDAAEVFALAESLRTALPQQRVIQNLEGGSFKAQFRKADRSGAEFAVILGERELAEGVVSVKALKNRDLPQQQISRKELPRFLCENLKK